MPSFRQIFAALATTSLMAASEGYGQAGQQPEYQVKALYLGVLAEYVRWPAKSGDDASRPLILGVLGVSPFDVYLNELYAKQAVKGRKVQIVYLKSPRGAEECDVLFICESEAERLQEILRPLRGKPILTIGDSPEFARRGVMVNLVQDRNRITFEINLPTVKSSGLEISSHVLRLAKIVE